MSELDILPAEWIKSFLPVFSGMIRSMVFPTEWWNTCKLIMYTYLILINSWVTFYSSRRVLFYFYCSIIVWKDQKSGFPTEMSMKEKRNQVGMRTELFYVWHLWLAQRIHCFLLYQFSAPVSVPFPAPVSVPFPAPVSVPFSCSVNNP